MALLDSKTNSFVLQDDPVKPVPDFMYCLMKVVCLYILTRLLLSTEMLWYCGCINSSKVAALCVCYSV